MKCRCTSSEVDIMRRFGVGMNRQHVRSRHPRRDLTIDQAALGHRYRYRQHSDLCQPGTIGAAPNGSAFEIDSDANLVVNNANCIDWLDWRYSGSDSRAQAWSPRPTLPSGSGDNSFGQGSKEDTAVPTIVSGCIPPNKSDLKTSASTPRGNGHDPRTFLNAVLDSRAGSVGTTNMDFELNHNACVAGATGNVCSANGVTPVRTEGDLLIHTICRRAERRPPSPSVNGRGPRGECHPR